jgi:Cu2+-exporting ATPase
MIQQEQKIQKAGRIKKLEHSNLIKEIFPVLQMSCAACAVSVESMIKSVEGVQDAGVNFASQEAWVLYDPHLASPEKFREVVQSIGYDLLIETEHQEEAKESAHQHHIAGLKAKTTWSVILAVPVVLIGMFFMDLPYANWIMLLLSAPVVFYFGSSFFVNAFRQARYRKSNMDTLVALSTGIAWLFSAFNTFFPSFWHQKGLHAYVYFEAATVVIAFILLGKLLEEKAKSNTSSAIKKLMGLQPKTVFLVATENNIKEIPVSQVKVNDILLVKPGSKIPVDGTINDGFSYVDESMITGEPVPVGKKPGDKIFAGTINQKGSFKFVAEKVGGETLLAQIIKMVREAQGSKAPVQKMVDKIAGVFVPIVIVISILTFISWMILGGENAFTHALLTSITVLVIACPCALGLATPTAIMVGMGKGAENNILIRDAESLETAMKVDTVILDKTGTITEGRPELTDIVFANGAKEDELKRILLSLELQSEHPLAEAVVRKLTNEGVESLAVSGFISHTGKGVSATFQSSSYLLGNEKFLIEKGIRPDNNLTAKLAQFESEAKTAIGFAKDDTMIAVIALADKIKTTSITAIKKMQDMQIEIHMLTGDNEKTASAIAEQVGIKDYKAGMSPDAKADYIKMLQRKGRVVAMVGDGINDSQALAEADVSIAMGKGSDIAMDVAKMTLITSDLNSIPKALRLSVLTVQTIRQNLFWAFVYNVIGIPIAAGVLFPVNGFLLDPMIAGAAMAMSSVSVVGNSLRLKWKKL